MTYWTNFARTGDPNGRGVPEWPVYAPERDVWLDLNHSIRVIEGLRARKLDILEETLLARITAMSGPPRTPDLPEPVTPDTPPAIPPEPEPVAVPTSRAASPEPASALVRPTAETTPAEPRPEPARPREPEVLPEPILRPLTPPAAPEPAEPVASDGE